MAGTLGSDQSVSRRRQRSATEVVLADNVSLSIGNSSRGPLVRVYRAGCVRPISANEWVQRPLPDGLRRFWFAGGKRRDPEQHPSCNLDLRKHRAHARPIWVDGCDDRLVARTCHKRSRLLSLEPVDLFEDARKGPRLSKDGCGLVVPERPDSARK